MKPEYLSLTSESTTKINLDALYKIAPSCFTEARDEKTGILRHVVDFHKLRQLLGDDAVEDEPEAYEFTWVGKQAAKREAATPIHKTLRPCPEKSMDWDKTQNIYIEGDNLEALKLLQKSYLGKIKMMYYDPPYNTGNDFVYKDDFSQRADVYGEKSGSVDNLGNKYFKNTEANGRFHSDWCKMMYSRLILSRNLLRNDGVIFISIDDHEIENLLKICNEVFGESNCIAKMVVNRTSEIATDLTVQKHEYCVVFAKDIRSILLCGNKKKTISRGTVGNADQTMPVIEFPQGLECKNIPDGTYTEARQIPDSKENIEVLSPFIVEKGVLKEPVKLRARWRSSNDMRNFFANSCHPTKAKINGDIVKIYFDGDRFMPYIVKEVTEKLPSMYLKNKRGSADLEKLNLNYFDFPKSVNFLKYLISLFTTNDDIILDIFSGSATTGHAVMQLNAEDGGFRKFILVQLQEETLKSSEAYKAGYKNLCEIGEERIRRAGKRIKEDNPLTTKNLDTGFRVYKADSSNMENVYFAPKDLKPDMLEGLYDNVKADRTEMDLLCGCMLDWGLQLSLPMTKETVDGCTIYTVNKGDLVACFSKNVTERVVRAMAEKEPLRVLFRDSCFAQDDQKINIFEQFKQLLGWSDNDSLRNIKVI